MKFNTDLIFLVAARAAAQVFPTPGGPFHVSWESSELVDTNRLDPFNSTHARRIMISRFTPVPKSSCIETCHVPYMTPEMADFEQEIFQTSLKSAEWINGMFQNLQVEVCCKVQSSIPAKKFPVILFGTGHNTTRSLYTGMLQQIASAGYEIVVMDHPYETDVVQFPNGDIIFGGRVGSDPDDVDDVVFGLDVRTKDVGFILDVLRIESTVYLGHSYGGASAASTLLADSRIVGGVNLDGALWGEVQYSGVNRPFLSFGSAGHNSSSDVEPSWYQFFQAMEIMHPDVWNKELSLKDSVHLSYSDISIIGDVTALRDGNEAFFGKMRGERVSKILRAYLSDFVQLTLLGGEDGLLEGPSPEFPDVSFLRQLYGL